MTNKEKFYRLACNIAKFTNGVSYTYYRGELSGISVYNGYFREITYSPYYGNSISIFDYQEHDTLYHCYKDHLDDLDEMIETIKNSFPGEEKELLDEIE